MTVECISVLSDKKTILNCTLQAKLIRFRSNSDPDLKIRCDCSDFQSSNIHMTTLDEISKNPKQLHLQNSGFKS